MYSPYNLIAYKAINYLINLILLYNLSLASSSSSPARGAVLRRGAKKKMGRDVTCSEDDDDGASADTDFGDNGFEADRNVGQDSSIRSDLGGVDVLCYEDIRLLVMRNPDSGGGMCLPWR